MMLVINRYENRQTGKVTIQAHVIKGKKLIKSYAPCCHSLIDIIAQNYPKFDEKAATEANAMAVKFLKEKFKLK